MKLSTVIPGLSLVALVTGCSLIPEPTHYVITETPTYDSVVSARIRVLTGNGTGKAAFRPGESCYKAGFGLDDKLVQVGDGFWATFKYSSRSIVIGMPKSPRPWMRVEGLKFKDLIREYVVPASQPLTISMLMSSSGVNYSYYCAPPEVTFTPQPGQDYDIFLDSKKQSCWIAVRHIDGYGMDKPVKVTRAPKCSPEDSASKG